MVKKNEVNPNFIHVFLFLYLNIYRKISLVYIILWYFLWITEQTPSKPQAPEEWI